MNFQLTEKQKQQFEEWRSQQTYIENGNVGAFSFIFIPNSIGIVILAKCINGNQIDLTDIDTW